MTGTDENFGTDDQRAVLRRGQALATILKGDPRYTYYGRTVGLARPADGDLDQLAALVRLQGNSNYGAVPETEAGSLAETLRGQGLAPMLYRKWEGGRDELAAARAVIEATPLPADLEMRHLDADSPPDLLDSLAAMALDCGVLPASGAALRGQVGRSVCIVATDRTGRVVSCAASAAYAHRDHPTLGGQCWWGMLATAPDRRGQKLALLLGAHALVDMEKRYGFRDFMTGVEPGNAASEAVCRRMGLAPRGMAILGCADPAALRGGRMTK